MLALTSAALAGTPVVVDGPPEVGVATVAARAGVPAETLSPVVLESVGAPGVPRALPCAGPPVRQDDLRVGLDEVLAAYDAARFALARQQATELTGATACLTDLVDPGWSWSASFVTGLLAWGDGDRAAAMDAWSAARGIDPQRPWDDDFKPGEALGAFATALPARSVGFRGVGGPFFADGRPAPDTLPAGPHVLQAGDPLQTWLVNVRAPLVAVHPAVDARGLPLDDLAVVLADRLPEESAAYVVRGDEVVRIELATGEVYPILAPAEPTRARKVWRRVLTGAGGVLVAGGALDIALGGLQARRSVVDGWSLYGAHDPTEQARAEADWAAGWNKVYAGSGLVGAGVVLVVVATADTAAR